MNNFAWSLAIVVAEFPSQNLHHNALLILMNFNPHNLNPLMHQQPPVHKHTRVLYAQSCVHKREKETLKFDAFRMNPRIYTCSFITTSCAAFHPHLQEPCSPGHNTVCLIL